MLVCRGREVMAMVPPPMHDSVVSLCFHGCPAFLHMHFHHNLLPYIPSIHLSTVNSSPCPGIAPQIPKLQLPTAAPSRGSTSLSGVCMAAARTVWFSFHLGCHKSAVSLSALNVSPLTQTNCPNVGIGPLLQFPQLPAKGKSSPTNTSVFPPSSFVLPSFVWVYIFFSTGQVLLSTLSWCSACTSVFEGVFLMYLWREIYSMSIYSCHLVPLPSFS